MPISVNSNHTSGREKASSPPRRKTIVTRSLRDKALAEFPNGIRVRCPARNEINQSIRTDREGRSARQRTRLRWVQLPAGEIFSPHPHGCSYGEPRPPSLGGLSNSTPSGPDHPARA